MCIRQIKIGTDIMSQVAHGHNGACMLGHPLSRESFVICFTLDSPFSISIVSTMTFDCTRTLTFPASLASILIRFACSLNSGFEAYS